MKKIFILIICLLFLSGCKIENKKSDSDILAELLDTITFPEEISENLHLKSSFEYNNLTISAQWFSDDESIMSNNGEIFPTQNENYLTLTLILKLNETSLSKTFAITILPLDNSSIAENILNKIIIPTNISNHITLDNFVKYDNKNYKISWKSSNENYLTNRGKIIFDTIQREVMLSATINYDGDIYTKDFQIIIDPFDTTIMTNYLKSLNIPTNISTSINLPTNTSLENHNFEIEWYSNNEEVLDKYGNINILTEDKNIVLTATMTIDNVKIIQNYDILVEKTNETELVNLIEKRINLPSTISNDIFLPTSIGNLNGTWLSDNEQIISSEGKINKNLLTPVKTKLSFEITIGGKSMTFTFDIIAHPINHFIMNNIFSGNKENLIINSEGKLELSPEQLIGTYYSEEISTHQFSEAVATWCATSSKNATCELFVSLKIGDTFSDYITYGEWGFELQNGSTDQTNNLIKLVDDEIKVLNNKYATGLKFKLILKRNKITDSSPSVSLVTFALNLVNYTYDIDSSLINDAVKYDVPKLYQHAVPTIGGIICSITSSTMLLKYKGYDFTDKNPLEHEYMAKLLFDYKNQIYGNWVFNCVGMSSFGERAYVKRFFGVNEFLYSLQEIGPMAASIKGTVKYVNLTSGTSGSYNTAGHLLVVTGFEKIDNQTFIYINDPNVNGVAIKMTLNDFLAVWRNVSYILEY